MLCAATPTQAMAIGDLASVTGLRVDQVQSSAEALVNRGLLDRAEEVRSRLVITDAGRRQLQLGLPELWIRNLLRVRGSATIATVQSQPGYTKAEIGAVFGALKRAGLLRVDGDQVRLVEGDGWSTHEQRHEILVALAESPDGIDQKRHRLIAGLPSVLADIESRLPPKRGRKGGEPFELQESRTRYYQQSEAGVRLAKELRDRTVPCDRAPVAQLTPQMLKDGSWRDVSFRAFNVAHPPATPSARRNPYRAFLDQVKQTLLALGFEEMTGSVVEPEFWNMDALFLPQFHPAREIHDVYFVEDAARPGECVFAREIEGGALEPVALEHEGQGRSGSRGWNYAFDRQRTKRLVLRSQGTVLSARALQAVKTPGKYFGMARCFRYDDVDETHAPDFFQIEGIVSSERTSFRHLLGLLELFARQVAKAPEVKFVPAYFPFTEPSVEVHMRHPDLGWMELGGAGIFRPEVTRPHGVDGTVIAWGLGLDRMAMVALGIKDIRHLFTNNSPEGLGSLRLK
ncbi:MAG: phenylalanine--tRNA ligase subunit alpha [Planctomycetota bacterium]|nr:phenylalanine--tRNA ligase subunit alpha [Planctomycetota bacterium]